MDDGDRPERGHGCLILAVFAVGFVLVLLLGIAMTRIDGKFNALDARVKRLEARR